MNRSTRPAIALVLVALVAGITVWVLTRHDRHEPPAPAGQASASACAAWDAATGAPPPPAFRPDAVALAPDGGGQTGVLDNGLHFFIRHNERPGANAELRLVVNAGSALEDADQAGAAHFVEHMLFNGTEKFPGNQLADTLRSLGVQLGPDLNAYTTYDETVYSLSVDTTNKDAVSTALDVLYQWATSATIEPAAVDSERGVILSEERQRDETPEGRTQQHAEDVLFAGTPYERHSPIGTVDSIDSMSADVLKRFYHDWYRPDLMAVVAVGDFDVGDMEQQVRSRFDEIAPPATERPRPVLTVTAPATAHLDTFDDPESTRASLEVLFGRGEKPDASDVDVRTRVDRDLALQMLNTRLADDAARALVPYYRTDRTDNLIARSFDIADFTIDAEPDQLRASLDSALAEIVRVRRLGFDDTELARAVATERQSTDRTLQNALTRQDVEWADDYTNAFLTGVPVPDAQGVHDAETAALDGLDAADAADALRAATGCRQLSVLATGPDSFAADVPSVDQVNEAIGRAAGAPSSARAAEAAPPAQLMDPPAPAGVVKQQTVHIFDDATELTFANGVRVVINPTPIQKDGFTFGALSPGGLSAVADGDVANAQLAAEMVDASGVGDLDAVQLQEALAGHLVDLHSSIDDATEGFTGSAATDDLETLLQLVHLRMTEPRVDEGARRASVGDRRVEAEDPNRSPDSARERGLDQLHFGDAPRERSLPTSDDLNAIAADRALAVYKARFGDASDFVFTITGAVSVDTATQLARRYLGTLPGSGRKEVWQDVRPDPPVSPNTLVVHSGQGTKASITLLYDVASPTDPITRAHTEILELLLRTRVFDQIREALSATYTPTVAITVRDRPDAGTETMIDVEVDASRVDEVVKAIDGVVADLAANGPSASELDAAITQVVRQESYYSNPSLSDMWLTHLTQPGGDVADEQRKFDALHTTTAADLVALAAQLWPADHRLELRVVPAG